jgi:hypothetical protein
MVTAIYFEVSRGVSVDVWVPQPGGFDNSPQILALGPQLRLHESHRAPFCQTPKTLGSDLSFSPKTKIFLVRSSYDIRKVRQPQRKRKIFWVGLVRPNPLKYNLKTIFLIAVHTSSRVFTLYLASSQAQQSLSSNFTSLAVCSQNVLVRFPSSAYQ